MTQPSEGTLEAVASTSVLPPACPGGGPASNVHVSRATRALWENDQYTGCSAGVATSWNKVDGWSLHSSA